MNKELTLLREVIEEGPGMGGCSISGCIMEMNLNESLSDKGLTKFRGKFQEAEAINKNKRMYPYSILDENVQKLQDTIKSRGLVGELDHPCRVDKDFRVLTVKGWKEFDSIREGDYVYSRVNGRMVESRVNKIIDEPYNGPAYKVKGNSIDDTFTPGHKILLLPRLDHKNKDQFYATIKEIHNNRKKYNKCSIPKTATWCGQSKSVFTIGGVRRKHTDKYEESLNFDTMKFAAFMGIYLAEGNVNGTNHVLIAQTNEAGRKLLREMLPQIHKDLVWKENKRGFETIDGRLHDYLAPLGNKYNKYIPNEIKSLDSVFLKELIRWFAIGDGRMIVDKEKNGITENIKNELHQYSGLDFGNYSRTDVFSVSKQLIDDLHECLIKSGGCGSRSVIITNRNYEFAGRIIEAKNKKPLYQLHISRSKNIHLDNRFLRITEVQHVGRIYCLSTEHGNFYMETKGKSFWTGNSDSIIHFDKCSHIVTKLWWDGNSLMGEGEILDTPHGKILKALLNNGVRIGISSRGVGSGKVDENGILVIGESYKLITFDAVADPSTNAAFQKEVKKENYSPKFSKNESSRIHTVSKKEALIACLGGIIQQQTSNIKRGLG